MTNQAAITQLKKHLNDNLALKNIVREYGPSIFKAMPGLITLKEINTEIANTKKQIKTLEEEN